jgi:cytoskeleton protein RodZ
VSEIENFESVPEANDAAPESEVGLGQQLREARQARGISIEDVVHNLKFSARQIEAIEADQMEVLPGSVFQRGLVRSYARFLKLDPEPLLALIESQLPTQEPEIRAPENMGNAAPKGGLSRIPPLVAVSVLLLIAAGLMVASHYLDLGTQKIASVAAQAVNSAVDESKVTEVAKPEIHPTVSPVVAPKPEPAAGIPTQGAVMPTPPTEVPTPAPAVVIAPPPVDGRRLSFAFQGESWIEVKDVTGLVILTGIYHSGVQSVVGRPPFEVVIGNAAVVALRDNNQAVDLKPYTRSEVARLTLK